jgi:GNAT superfamily N-acetyltransferase
VLAVDPKHQQRGIGALLMQWGIDIAEKLRVPIYLESTLAAVRLYEKIGFERIKESVVQKPEITGLDHDIEVPLFYKMPKSNANIDIGHLVGERHTHGAEPRAKVMV